MTRLTPMADTARDRCIAETWFALVYYDDAQELERKLAAVTAKLAACRATLETIAKVTGTSTEANKLARETLELTKP